jgi:hypothetical protein
MRSSTGGTAGADSGGGGTQIQSGLTYFTTKGGSGICIFAVPLYRLSA